MYLKLGTVYMNYQQYFFLDNINKSLESFIIFRTVFINFEHYYEFQYVFQILYKLYMFDLFNDQWSVCFHKSVLVFIIFIVGFKNCQHIIIYVLIV